MMWLEYIDGLGEARLLLAPIKETGAGDDPLYGYLRRVQMTRRDHENTRLLYVATTRARKRLHLLGHTRIETDARRARIPATRTLLRKIWDVVEPEFERALALEGPVTKAGNVLDAVEARGVPLRRLSRDWQAPPPSRDIDSPLLVTDCASEQEPVDASMHPAFEWASELQRRVGIVVHAMLQRMSVRNAGDRNRETIRRALASEGLDGARLDEASRRVEMALEGTLSDEKGRWILSEHEDDRREYPLSGIVAGRVRRFLLDRTFVDGDIRWIIDYKTGRHEGAGGRLPGQRTGALSPAAGKLRERDAAHRLPPDSPRAVLPASAGMAGVDFRASSGGDGIISDASMGRSSFRRGPGGHGSSDLDPSCPPGPARSPGSLPPAVADLGNLTLIGCITAIVTVFIRNVYYGTTPAAAEIGMQFVIVGLAYVFGFVLLLRQFAGLYPEYFVSTGRTGLALRKATYQHIVKVETLSEGREKRACGSNWRTGTACD